MFGNADDGDITVLDTGFNERFFVQICNNVGMSFYFFVSVIKGIIISSIEMPPCWNVSL